MYPSEKQICNGWKQGRTDWLRAARRGWNEKEMRGRRRRGGGGEDARTCGGRCGGGWRRKETLEGTARKGKEGGEGGDAAGDSDQGSEHI
jgi:hypothetical protein